MTEWQDLQRWSTGEPITATKLNAITNNTTYLYERHVDVLNVVGGSNLTVSGTTFARLTGYTVTTNVRKGKTLMFGASFCYGLFSTATASAFFDILDNDLSFISSGTTTPLTYGLYSTRTSAVNSIYPINFVALWTPTDTRTTTFQLMAKMNATIGTCTIYCANSLSQFFVVEV